MAKRMGNEQEAHLARVKAAFLKKVDAKYRKGQAEHGGIMPEFPSKVLYDEIENEIIDLFVYVQTLREKLGLE